MDLPLQPTAFGPILAQALSEVRPSEHVALRVTHSNAAFSATAGARLTSHLDVSAFATKTATPGWTAAASAFFHF